jgi:hypothetical protein
MCVCVCVCVCVYCLLVEHYSVDGVGRLID